MNTFRIVGLLVLAVSAVTLRVKADEYDDIDNYLLKNSRIVSSTFERLTTLEQLLTSEKESGHTASVAKLEKLVAIKDALTKDKCTAKSYKLLDDLSEEWFEKAPRTYYLITSAALDHAKMCLDTLLSTKSNQMSDMDQDELKLVKEYTDIMISKSRSDPTYTGVLSTSDIEQFFENNQDVLNMIQSHLKADGDNQKVDFTEACLKYVISPCDHFSQQMTEVFKHWRSTTELVIVNQQKQDLMDADFHRFLICDYMKDQGKDRLLNELKALSSQ